MHLSRRWVRFVLPVLLCAAPVFVLAAGQGEKQAPKEVRALEGAYTGAWTMYGVDGKGEVVKRMVWTDTMKATGAQVQGDRAYVTTANEMTFEGGRIPPVKMQGKEGYLLAKDGSVADYFMEMNGQVTRMVKLSDSVFTYTVPASTQELAMMGFPQDASGSHVLVKVVTKEQGAETHRITRVTTVTWKDAEGKERALQFTSLQGYHRRQP